MKSLASLLPSLLTTIARDEKDTVACLEALWPEIVGETIAKNSQPVKIEAKVLTVQVRSQGWTRELPPMEAKIRRRINELWKANLIERIRWVLHQ